MLAMMGSAPPLGSPPLWGGAGSPLLDPGGEPGNSAPPPVAGLLLTLHNMSMTKPNSGMKLQRALPVLVKIFKIENIKINYFMI